MGSIGGWEAATGAGGALAVTGDDARDVRHAAGGDARSGRDDPRSGGTHDAVGVHGAAGGGVPRRDEPADGDRAGGGGESVGAAATSGAAGTGTAVTSSTTSDGVASCDVAVGDEVDIGGVGTSASFAVGGAPGKRGAGGTTSTRSGSDDWAVELPTDRRALKSAARDCPQTSAYSARVDGGAGPDASAMTDGDEGAGGASPRGDGAAGDGTLGGG